MTTTNPNTAFKTTDNTHRHNHTILHHIGRRLLLLTTLLAMAVGMKAQTPTTVPDGVYKIFWQSNGRGYLTYHNNYSTSPQLAGVTLSGCQNLHYDLGDAGIQLSWYLYTSPHTKKSYLFEATTGKFITINLGQTVGNGKQCVLSDDVTAQAQFDLKATTNITGSYMLSYEGYNFCSGCGSPKGNDPVRFATDGPTDGGIPFVFVSEGASITDGVKNAAIAKIDAFEIQTTTFLPLDGRAYTFTNIMGNDAKTKRYMNYTSGQKISVTTDESQASVFVCRKIRDGVYAFVTTDGKVLTWVGNNEGEAYKDAGQETSLGYSNNYATEYNGHTDWNEITIKQVENEETIGQLRMVARRNSTSVSSFIVSNANRFDQSNDSYYFNQNYSSVWQITEVTSYTTNDAQNLALAKISAKEAVKHTKVPGTKVCQYTYTITSGQTTEAAAINAAIDEATTLAEVNAIMSPTINQPQPRKQYRIKGYTSGNYIDGVNLRSGYANQLGMKSNAQCHYEGTVFYLDEHYHLFNLGANSYVQNTYNIGGTDASASVWTFEESANTPGCITLTSTSATGGLHDYTTYVGACGTICTGTTHDFILEEVTIETPQPMFVFNLEYTEATITCSTKEGVIYYTTDGSDPTTSSTKIELTVGNTVTFTSGQNIKAYAHRTGCERSDVIVMTIPTGMIEVTSIDQIEEFGYYVLTQNIDASSHTSLANFSGILDGGFYTISGLTQPLFTQAANATIKNVVLKEANITDNTDNTGAIAGTASGVTHIYNCGVLSGSISGNGNVGGIAGKIEGSARVINCYSFADITGGATKAGIVGYNSEISNAGRLYTLVISCMFYGNITDGGNVYPIYGGEKISNMGDAGTGNGINNYNYYRHEADLTPTGDYNCALAAEERYLRRFEFYRHVLNSQRKLNAFYITGNVNDYERIAKWVLDTDVAPYPILKPWGKYASAINKKVKDEKKLGTLYVTIQGKDATGSDLSSKTISLDITDIDANSYDYNYYKVQLPYYNDHFTDNYTNNKVVTGWKIVNVGGVTTSDITTTGDARYNFADRKSKGKDVGRILAQGGYFNVPEGVTSITIEPYWGKAIYLSDSYYDVIYEVNSDGLYIGRPFTPAGETADLYVPNKNYQGTDQPVLHSMGSVWAKLTSSATTTVYDNAIVLVGNYHSFDESWSYSTIPFTIMSIDENRDNEPDYSLYFKTSVRPQVNPIRFDFLNHVNLGMAAKVDGREDTPGIAIFRPKGWFEVTETALAIYTEFEYDENGGGKTSSPLILNGGIYEQFCSALYGTTANRTPYIIVGGNCYFKAYTPGCQSGATTQTYFAPVSILGGEYEEFYLSGVRPEVVPVEQNVLCYGNGGKIGTFAGAGQEQINGNVIIKLDHMLIDEFYGGGINEKKPILGNIDVTINNSNVGSYCGGPKFGDMADKMTVTTNAKNTTFGSFFGAGYGGTSLYRYKNHDANGQTIYNSSWLNSYTDNRGKYYNTNSDDRGIMVDYETEHFCYAGGGSVNARFYTYYAALSVAKVKNVTSTLIGCTIIGDLYGGGNLGKADGDLTTTLENCTVGGSVYAGGFSAAIPTCEVMPMTPPTYSTYNTSTGVFTPTQYPPSETFTWAQAGAALVHGNSYIDDTEKLIYTKAVDLSDLGTVEGNTTIKIKGNSHIHGSVFGGGNASKVKGNTRVYIQGGTIDGNVFGAGNQAEVTGKTEVIIGGE